MDRTLEDLAAAAAACPEKIIHPTHSLDFDLAQADWIVAKVRHNRIYAQNLYAALCNNLWQAQDAWEVLRDKTWSCSWRGAGRIVADMQGEGDYMDWYCSGMITGHPDDDLGTADYKIQKGFCAEGTVSQEIAQDLRAIGWRRVVDQ